MDNIHFIVLLSAFVFLVIVVSMTAKNKLTDQYAFMWLTFSIIGVVLAIALPYLNDLATALGIAYMPSLIFLLAFLVVLSLLIYHTQLLSKQEHRIKLLIQEVAFLQKDIQDARKEDRNS
ncbi:DUF2304 domain-containing protein [Planococcus salinus]|uniref:DUF2304 domain-containing protein n=1 Tax=Planococcus salinus TaxID=1848460 RepID=A0A3M8P3F5_9BACL|nr:DUF2304 domain-containing protein [Planococcus salinus]RNF38249.1 DUF2304 domain-containing protein [Planococcus salinus]